MSGCFQFGGIIHKAAINICVFVYIFYGHMLLFLLGKYLGVELLSPVVHVCLYSYKIAKGFPKCLYYFACSPGMFKEL